MGRAWNGFALLVICFAPLWSTAALAAVSHLNLADDPMNAAWNISETSSDIIWLGGKERSALMLKKTALMSGSMEIETDAKEATLRASDAGRVVRLPLNGKVTQLRFGGSADRPALEIGGKEMPALRGPWIALSLENSATRTIEFQGATFATVRFSSPEPTEPTTAPSSQPTLRLRGPGSKVPAAQLIAVAKALPTAISHKCPRCSGTGLVTTRVQTGTRHEGIYNRPVMSDKTVKCEKCNGSKVERATDPAIQRLADTLVKSMANLNMEDPKAQAALNESFAALTDGVIGDRPTWILLNTRGRGTVAQRLIDPQTPVILQARFVSSVPGAADTEREFVGVVGGTDQKIIVRHAVTAEEARPDTFVLMGGLVNGVGQATNGDRVVVIEHGFVVAPNIPKDWYWWWRWGLPPE